MARRVMAWVAAGVVLTLAGSPATADNGATYQPPYAAGPSGGGAGSYTDLGEDGRVFIGRLYPVPGPLNCPPGGAYARYEVEHTLTGPVSAVTADFTEPAVDQFVFAVLSVRDADGRWLGSAQQRGPILVDDGALGVDLDPALFTGDDALEPGEVLVIQFGLEMASACPHVNGGTVRFTQLSVS